MHSRYVPSERIEDTYTLPYSLLLL